MPGTSEPNGTTSADIGRNGADPASAGLQFYRAVLKSLPVGLVIYNRQLKAVWSNPAAVAMLAALDELPDDLTRLCKADRTVDWRAALTEAITFGRSNTFTGVQVASPVAQAEFVDIVLLPLAAQLPGVGACSLMVVIDVSANCRPGAVPGRLAALGRMAAKVAHELNNPLDGIARFIGLARRAMADNRGDKADDYLAKANEGLLRMSRILAELLDFSRGHEQADEAQDINTLVEQAIQAVEPLAEAADVSIITDYHKPMPAVAEDLFQVFCNLAKNGIQAAPHGGQVIISTRTEKDHAVIRFEDTGQGLPEPVEQIFEPFFTTKPRGQGTGLGLAVCKEIVEKHGGWITARDSQSGGAVFEVRIPIGESARAANRDTNRDGETQKRRYGQRQHSAG